MSFSVNHLGLSNAIGGALREIRDKTFQGPAPRLLHHYTREVEVVESIVRDRALWAKRIADQVDQTEISHASEMVKQFAEESAVPNLSLFQHDVLRRLPFFMEERKQWIFIACFCEDSASVYHRSEYGNYCLAFPSLALRDSQAECWYQRVIYDEELQRNAIDRALRAIMLAIAHNTSGKHEGQRANFMVDFCARNTAQLLLGLAVGFKQKKFSEDREWRIVCGPPLGTNNSAPAWIDENFSRNIVERSINPRVLLQVNRMDKLFQRPLTAPVPFLDWSWNPNRYIAQEVERINDALKSNNRPDLIRRP